MKRYRSLGHPLDGADVVVVGLFSAKDRDWEEQLDDLAALVGAHGGRVVGRHRQRRGASDRWRQRPGGAARMSQPFSRRTLLSGGKVREVAAAVRAVHADAVVFVNALTSVQRTVLTGALGCVVFSRDDILDGPGTAR